MFAVFLHWCAALWLVALAAAVRAHPGGCAVLPAPTNIRAADSDGPDRGLGLSHTDPTDFLLHFLRQPPSAAGSTLLRCCTAVYMRTRCEALPRHCWRLAADSGSALISAAPFGGPEVSAAALLGHLT